MMAHLLTASRAPGSALDTGAEDAADCVGLFRRSFIMVKQVKVSNFTEVKGIVSAAAKCYNDVGVHDMKGSIADAKTARHWQCRSHCIGKPTANRCAGKTRYP